MNKFCRSLVVNLHHLRSPMFLGRPMHVQSTLALLSLGDRTAAFRVFPANSNSSIAAAARPYFKEKRYETAREEGGESRFRSSYGNKPPRQFNNQRPRGSTTTKPLDEDEFGDAVPVESVGHEVSFEAASNGFAEFNLPETLLHRLEQLGYKKPFEIQAATLKQTLAGKDVVGKAFTGSGKTLAFAIPIIVRVMKSENREKKTPKCLVLSPTRELCLQLYKSIQELAPEVKCTPIFGGAGYDRQIEALSRGVDVVIATPGRLRDLMQRKNFIPDDIELVCLDEADEMLNPNFLEQIQEVIESSRKDKQMLMFSATLNKSVAELADQYMNKPTLVDLTKGKTQKLPANIEHYIHRASPRRHVDLVHQVIEKFDSQRCMVFVNQKKLATLISNRLIRSGIKSSDLHSDRSQRTREIILSKFREGRINVVVATDVASRGIDVPEVDLVIQLEAPPSGVDYYIHRTGRTGRAGRKGTCVMIHSGSGDSLSKDLSRLVKFKKIDLPEDDVIEDDYERESSSTLPPRFKKRFERDNFDDEEKFPKPWSSKRFDNEKFGQRTSRYGESRLYTGDEGNRADGSFDSTTERRSNVWSRKPKSEDNLDDNDFGESRSFGSRQRFDDRRGSGGRGGSSSFYQKKTSSKYSNDF